MFVRSEPSASAAAHADLQSKTEFADQLPQELWDQIFSYLGKSDLQSAALAARGLASRVVQSANYSEPASLKQFVKALSEKLDEKKFPGQIASLMQIYQGITSKNFVNLRLMKDYILDMKEELIQVIKTVDVEIIHQLKYQMEPPHFMEDVFSLAYFQNLIDAANELTEEDIREGVFESIVESLTKDGFFDKAIEVANLIHNKSNKEHLLVHICTALGKNSNYDKAIMVAESIDCESVRSRAFLVVSYISANLGDFDKAIEIVKSLNSQHLIHEDAMRTLWTISEALVRAGNTKKAIEVAMLIADESARTIALEYIQGN